MFQNSVRKQPFLFCSESCSSGICTSRSRDFSWLHNIWGPWWEIQSLGVGDLTAGSWNHWSVFTHIFSSWSWLVSWDLSWAAGWNTHMGPLHMATVLGFLTACNGVPRASPESKVESSSLSSSISTSLLYSFGWVGHIRSCGMREIAVGTFGKYSAPGPNT